MGKVDRSASQEVIIELVRMKCLPILLYGTKACPLAQKVISSMEHILNCKSEKIFIVNQPKIINEFQKAFNLDNLNQIIKNRQLKFIGNFLSQITLFVEWLVLFRVLILLSLFAIILSCNYYTVLGYYSLSLFIYLIYMFIMFYCCLLWHNKALYIWICIEMRIWICIDM